MNFTVKLFQKNRSPLPESEASVPTLAGPRAGLFTKTAVGFAFEHLQNITFDGQGSEFIFHGRMIPFALLNGKNINALTEGPVDPKKVLRLRSVGATQHHLVDEVQ